MYRAILLYYSRRNFGGNIAQNPTDPPIWYFESKDSINVKQICKMALQMKELNRASNSAEICHYLLPLPGKLYQAFLYYS
jgi:hypothetical protein